MISFSGRGHSYRVQKPNNSKTLKSKQRATEHQKRKLEEAMGKRLEEVEARLKASEEEKPKALDKETRDQEMQEVVGSLQAKLDAIELEKALKKEKKEAKRATQERQAAMEQVASTHLAPVETELQHLRQQRTEVAKGERRRGVKAAAGKKRQDEKTVENEKKELEEKREQAQVEEQALQVAQLDHLGQMIAHLTQTTEQGTAVQMALAQLHRLADLFGRVMERRMQVAQVALADTAMMVQHPLAVSYHEMWTAYITLLSDARTAVQAGFSDTVALLLTAPRDQIPGFPNSTLVGARRLVASFDNTWATMSAQHQLQRRQAFPVGGSFPPHLQEPAALIMLEDGVREEMQQQQQDQHQHQQRGRYGSAT
jgi:hypothetical protein